MNGGRSPGGQRGCRGPTDGVSLLDVFLIIAFVVIIAAFLFPILARPHRGHGRKDSCQSNLKELGMAFVMYHGDYDATLPSSYLYGRSKTWNRSDFIGFASERGTLPPPQKMNSGASWPELFYPYMKNKDIIWCPSDPDTGSNREDAIVSYFYKAAVDRAWYGDGNVKCQKEGDFDFPADQVVLYEHNGWHWGEARKGFADGVALNTLFLDGHVQTKRIVNSGGSEVTPAPAKGEPAWFNYSGGSKTPAFSTGAHWDPHVWHDNLE